MQAPRGDFRPRAEQYERWLATPVAQRTFRQLDVLQMQHLTVADELVMDILTQLTYTHDALMYPRRS